MDEPRARYSTEEISSYLQKFESVETREGVVSELIKGEMLKKVLDTPEGRLLMESTIDGIRANVMKIVRLCVDGFSKNADDVEQAALQIGIAYDFIHGIAKTLVTGEAHEKAMKGKY